MRSVYAECMNPSYNSLDFYNISADASCANYLGMRNGDIADSQITATTSHDHCDLYLSRLDSTISWCATSNDQDQYVQVDLLELTHVTGVITQGRENHAVQWVTSYKVKYSRDGSSWGTVQDADSADIVSVLLCVCVSPTD